MPTKLLSWAARNQTLPVPWQLLAVCYIYIDFFFILAGAALFLVLMIMMRFCKSILLATRLG